MLDEAYDEDDEIDVTCPTIAIPALVERMDALAATLALKAILRVHENDHGFPIGVELTDLNAEVPGEGAGTAYMTKLAEEAEAASVALYVLPSSPRNKVFYARFGFETSTRFHGCLQRLPGVPAWVMAP